MALYKYKKNKNVNYNYSENIILNSNDISKKAKFNIFEILVDIYNYIKEFIKSSRLANFLIPSIFIIIGLFFIYKEFLPDIQNTIQNNFGFLSQGNLTPVSDQYIDLSNYISKPVDFPTLTAKALQQNILQVDEISKNYQGTFYLSIPALNFNKLPVQANVDSTSEDVYLKVLNSKLAHFKNTGLPISNVKNNIMIYGHSASPNYNPKPTDTEVAFSFLDKLQIGDDIYLYIDNKTFQYKMAKSKIVEPTDTSVITGSPGKSTLTLVTCNPAGSNLHRLAVIARPVDENTSAFSLLKKTELNFQ